MKHILMEHVYHIYFIRIKKILLNMTVYSPTVTPWFIQYVSS